MVSKVISLQDVEDLEQCIEDGGVAVFPTDTVYGLCCDPNNHKAAEKLYALKGRPSERPAAVMFFSLSQALETLNLQGKEQKAAEALLPGALTLLLPNYNNLFLEACKLDPTTVGLRVPQFPENLSSFSSLSIPVMQSSCNLSGAADIREINEVPPSILEGVDLILDGGELPGTSSTIIDLRHYETGWKVIREGAYPVSLANDVLQTIHDE